MVLKMFCTKCKIEHVYDGDHTTHCYVCHLELKEIYKCDYCNAFLNENTVNNYEVGIECFDLCNLCYLKK